MQTTNDIVRFAAAAFVAPVLGAVLGMIYFSALPWTIRRALQSRSPVIWIAVSQYVRTALLLAGFYVAAHGEWRRFLAALLGFWIIRMVITWRLTNATALRLIAPRLRA